MSPLVSIIMPNYNYADFLEESVKSVLGQTHSNIELIIIDDGSSDQSIERIKQFQNDNRVLLIENKQNKGVSYCRNKGIESAQGSFLAFIDPDDHWELNKIELQLKQLVEQDANLCFSNITIIDADGIQKKERKHHFKEYTYKKLLKRNFIPHSSLIIKSELVKNLSYPEIKTENYILIKLMNLTNTNRLIHEDFAFLLNIFKQPNVKAVHIEESLVYYRTHQNNYSGNHLKKILSLFCIFSENQHFSSFTSLFFTLRLAVLATIKNLR